MLVEAGVNGGAIESLKQSVGGKGKAKSVSGLLDAVSCTLACSDPVSWAQD